MWFAAQDCLADASSLIVHRSKDGTQWDSAQGSAPTTAVALEDAGFVSGGPGGTLYAVSHVFAPDFSVLTLAKSTDGGATFGTPLLINRSPSAETGGCWGTVSASTRCLRRNVIDQSANVPTPILVDPRDPSRLYVAWTDATITDYAGGSGLLNPWEHATKVYLGRSDDDGGTWSVRQIFDAGDSPFYDSSGSNELENWFPTAAVGPAGTVYVAFARRGPGSTESHVLLLTSHDGGHSWTRPIQLDTGLHATFAPRLVTGPSGSVAVAFYGTQAHDETDPHARWNVYVSRLVHPGSTQPHVLQSLVENDVHTGALCPQGTTSGGNCTDAAHMTVGAAMRPDGTLLVAYVNDAGRAPVMHLATTDRTRASDQ